MINHHNTNLITRDPAAYALEQINKKLNEIRESVSGIETPIINGLAMGSVEAQKDCCSCIGFCGCHIPYVIVLAAACVAGNVLTCCCLSICMQNHKTNKIKEIQPDIKEIDAIDQLKNALHSIKNQPGSVTTHSLFQDKNIALRTIKILSSALKNDVVKMLRPFLTTLMRTIADTNGLDSNIELGLPAEPDHEWLVINPINRSLAVA